MGAAPQAATGLSGGFAPLNGLVPERSRGIEGRNHREGSGWSDSGTFDKSHTPFFSIFLNDSRDGLSFLTELRLRVDRATGRHLGAKSEELGAPASSQCTGGREPL